MVGASVRGFRGLFAGGRCCPWGSKLESQRLKKCAFRVGETLFFAFGGRLKEEAKPTKAEEPQEEAKDAQKLAQRGSTSIIE